MRNVRFLISYDGSRFFGWQRQEGFDSVQQALEEALTAITSDPATLYGAGRTDTGVHALGQVANAHLDTRLDDERLAHALNAHLPEGVVVRRAETCSDDFHSRFDARGKRYLYRVVTERFRPAFGRELTHFLREPLDLQAMRAAGTVLVGEHDFTSFANAGSPRSTNVRSLERLKIVARRRGFTVVLQGSGFLYNMARNIVGTLLEVGRGKMTPAEVSAVLEGRDRSLAGPTAPSRGLYLWSVRYDEPAFVALRPDARPRPGVIR